jgi:tRNA U34 5-methylaminomethyl-2-thiouridine-forming methyltransferase MnmC
MGIKSTCATFEIVTTTWGAVSIKDNVTGEIMHNPVGPWLEAHDLYVAQSGLERLLRVREAESQGSAATATELPSDSSADSVTLFDVGLGAGFNALSALVLRFQLGEGARKLKIVSFENKLDLFAFSRDNLHAFEKEKALVELLPAGAVEQTISELQSIMGCLLENGYIQGQGFEWILRHGEFPQAISQEVNRPDVVFYDPYSPKVNPEMWTLDCFKRLHDLSTHSRRPLVLMTYSVSTPVRVTMLLAGFFVGVGHTTGLKETTFAATDLAAISEPLGTRWLERWERSQTPLPLGASLTKAEVGQILLKHQQFDNLPPLRI